MNAFGHSPYGILHDLKTDLKISKMSLSARQEAYASLGVKVLSYLFMQHVGIRLTHKTFHQLQLELSGQRQMLSDISKHFHEHIPKEHT